MKALCLRNSMLLLLLALLCSCSAMKSKHYVGKIKKIAPGEMKENTIWQFAENAYFVRMEGSGRFRISTVRWDKKSKAHKLDSKEGVISELDKSMFLNVRESDGLYSIFKMAGTGDNAFIIFSVKPEKLRRDMKDGKIKASEKDNIFILKVDKKAQDKYISDNMDSLFDYNSAGIVRPLTKIKPKKK